MQALAAIGITLVTSAVGAAFGAVIAITLGDQGADDFGIGTALHGLVGAGIGGVVGAVSGAAIYAQFVA